MSELPVWNEKPLLALCSGRRAKVAAIVSKAINSIRQLADELEKLPPGRTRAHAIIHAIKGVALNCSFDRLASVCADPQVDTALVLDRVVELGEAVDIVKFQSV